jgi:hypothetical protein
VQRNRFIPEGDLVVKKRAKKKTPKAKPRKPTLPPRAGDRSRLDTKPLQEHIRQRIKDLQSGAGAAREGTTEQTIARLQVALDTLMDMCHPTMDIPI